MRLLQHYIQLVKNGGNAAGKTFEMATAGKKIRLRYQCTPKHMTAGIGVWLITDFDHQSYNFGSIEIFSGGQPVFQTGTFPASRTSATRTRCATIHGDGPFYINCPEFKMTMGIAKEAFGRVGPTEHKRLSDAARSYRNPYSVYVNRFPVAILSEVRGINEDVHVKTQALINYIESFHRWCSTALHLV